jgi:hypothetical protein
MLAGILLLFYLYFVQRLKAGIPSEEYPSLEEIGKCLGELVFGENTGGNAEYLI